ncbi:MAG: ribonuclease P protein component [Phycisphaerales bacterium]|nr:ribonuclease P protein component [Phycisphaerales bacterium]
MSDLTPGRRFRFNRAVRLKSSREFDAVYTKRVRKSIGPLLVYSAPNGTSTVRLGLSLPRRVGTAVRRNIIKRRLREAFRLSRQDLPPGYDVVVNVKPHEPLSLAMYKQLLCDACLDLQKQWKRRNDRESGGA